jgi:hypothetical protein
VVALGFWLLPALAGKYDVFFLFIGGGISAFGEQKRNPFAAVPLRSPLFLPL